MLANVASRSMWLMGENNSSGVETIIARMSTNYIDLVVGFAQKDRWWALNA